MIDFAQNFNALGAPKGIKDFVSQNVDSLFSYPQPQNTEVNFAIANLIDCKTESVNYINGSTEAFFNLPKFLDKPNALIVQPTFWEYKVANRKNGIIAKTFALKESENFSLNVDVLEKRLEKNSVVYLCNPNNPTSTLTKKMQLVGVISKYKEILFVVDETYLIFRHDYSRFTLTKKAQNLSNLYVVSSLSKIFSLPGIRAGFLVSTPKNISLFSRRQIPYASSSLSEEVTKWAVKQTKFITETRNYYLKTREIFYEDLVKSLKRKLLPFRPEANFILAKILTSQTSSDVIARLKTKGLLIRDGKDFKGLNNKWIRFAIKTKEENEILIKNLRDILT